MMTVRGRRVLYDLGQYPESIAVLEEGLAVSKIVYPLGERESVLFIDARLSNLYTS